MSKNSRNRRKAAAGLAGLGSAAAIMGAGIAAMATGSVPTAAPQADHSGVQSATLTQATTTTGDNAGFTTKPPVPSTTTSTSSSAPSNTTPVTPGGTSTTQSDSKAPNPNDVLPGGGFWQSLLAPTSIPGAGNAGFSTISTTAPFGVGFNSVLPGGINFASVPSGGAGFSVPFWTGNTSPDDNKPTGFSITPFVNENFSVPIQNGGGGGFTVPDTITFPGNGGPATSTLGTAFQNFFNGTGGSGPSYTYTAPSWVTQVGGSYPGMTYNPGINFAGGPVNNDNQMLMNVFTNASAKATQDAINTIDANTNAYQQIMNNLQSPTPGIVPFSDANGTFGSLPTGVTPSQLNALFPPAPGTTPTPSSTAPDGTAAGPNWVDQYNQLFPGAFQNPPAGSTSVVPAPASAPGGTGNKSAEVQAPPEVQTVEAAPPEVQGPPAPPPVQTAQAQVQSPPVQTVEAPPEVQGPPAPPPVQTVAEQAPPDVQPVDYVDAGGDFSFG